MNHGRILRLIYAKEKRLVFSDLAVLMATCVDFGPPAAIEEQAREVREIIRHTEHFCCVEPIIRFSMQLHSEPLVPLRVPRAIERLDLPLIDIYVDDRERRGKSKVNPAEGENHRR